MTLREIYKNLKDGASYKNGYQYIRIGTCERYGSPSYGKKYIYWHGLGSSANKVIYENFLFIVHVIFGINTAKEFNDYFMEE